MAAGLPGGGLAAVRGAGFQVDAQVGAGAVPGDPGRAQDGPGAAGQVRGPPRAGSAVVLAARDRGADGPLGGVVVQRQAGELTVAGQPVPFAVQGGQHLRRGRVQQVRAAPLNAAVSVDVLQRRLERGSRAGMPGSAFRGGGQLPVRRVQRPDPGGPGIGPGAQLLAVGVAGPDEPPADVGKAPQRRDAVELGKRPVHRVEIRADDQRAAAFGQLAAGHAVVAFQDLQRPRRRDLVHHRAGAGEHPEPPAVPAAVGGLPEHPPGRLIHVRVPGRGVPGGDRAGQRRQQDIQPPGHPGQRARRHLQPLKRQHRDHPVKRQPERVLSDQQVHAELRREQAPAGQLRRAGRGHHRRHRAPAGPGVLTPPVHDTPHPDPPRDLLAGILPEQLIGAAAPRAAPLTLRHIVDLLLSIQMVMPAPPMPRRPRPLTPASFPGPAAVTPAITPAARPVPVPAAGFRPAGVALLARGTEQHPAQRHHPLLQRGDLLPLHGHRPGQRRVLRRQPHVLRRQRPRPLTPEHRLISGGTGTNWRHHRAKTAPSPRSVSSTARTRVSRQPDGITEYLRPDHRGDAA